MSVVVSSKNDKKSLRDHKTPVSSPYLQAHYRLRNLGAAAGLTDKSNVLSPVIFEIELSPTMRLDLSFIFSGRGKKRVFFRSQAMFMSMPVTEAEKKLEEEALRRFWLINCEKRRVMGSQVKFPAPEKVIHEQRKKRPNLKWFKQPLTTELIMAHLMGVINLWHQAKVKEETDKIYAPKKKRPKKTSHVVVKAHKQM